MGFAINIGKWAEGAKGEMARINKSVVFELFSAVIKDTPVLEGRLRGNWIISSDNPASGTVKIEQTDVSSESKSRKDGTRGRVTSNAINSVFAHIAKVDFGSDIDLYLTNNLPYAYRIEYDGWSESKAPAGMVRENLIRVIDILAGV